MSNIKLRPVDALGATPKEFETDLEPSVSSIVIHSDGYMRTSTLPAIMVPKLSSSQIAQAVTAMTMGQIVVLSVEDEGSFAVAEADSENMTIKIPYVNYFVTYEVSGDNAIAEYVDVSGTNKQDKLTAGNGITIENNVISALGGSGTKLYLHTIDVFGDNWYSIFAVSTNPVSFTGMHQVYYDSITHLTTIIDVWNETYINIAKIHFDEDGGWDEIKFYQNGKEISYPSDIDSGSFYDSVTEL